METRRRDNIYEHVNICSMLELCKIMSLVRC